MEIDVYYIKIGEPMKKLLIIVLILFSISCSDSTRAKFGGYGEQFQIELFAADGSLIDTWISTGKVQSEANSDGYYFLDKDTKKLVEVTGTLVIKEL